MKWGVTKPRVYVTRLLPKEAMDRIHSHCDAKVWGGELSPPRDVLLRNVADVEGLVCLLTDRIDSKLMDRAPNMKVVSNYAVGFDNIDVTEATNRGILIGNTPDALTETTADFAFALIMSAARRIAEADSYVRGGKWHTWGPMLLLGRDVHNSTLGIIGLGRIGAAVARRARGFNMHILYSSRVRQRQREQELGIEYAELDKVLAESDFITVHTTLSPGTHHLLSAKHFEKMKRTCILVNTARGPVASSREYFVRSARCN